MEVELTSEFQDLHALVAPAATAIAATVQVLASKRPSDLLGTGTHAAPARRPTGGAIDVEQTAGQLQRLLGKCCNIVVEECPKKPPTVERPLPPRVNVATPTA